MTFTPDRRRRAGLALALALAGMGGAGQAGEGASATYVREAHAALARGDGIAAEMALRRALAAGLPREAVAARMGEAYLDQGERARAREWLGGGRFVPSEAAHGYRVLGRLEMAEGNLPAAGRAFDQALKRTPDDSRLWVDIARLRYAGGEHLQAVEAAERAVGLDPANVRALEFRGLLVRDQVGLVAALPWFEAGLKLRPDDQGLLGEYAATLGELGRAREMLAVTRQMIALEPRNPRAYFLQAVLAARAGRPTLARALFSRAGQQASEMPSGLLLQGVLELQAGNSHLAAELFDRLSRQQTGNAQVRMLLARAMALSASPQMVVDTFAAEASRADASPYLLTLVGRAFEDLGARDRAAPLLDRAAWQAAVPLIPLAEAAPLGVLALRYADAPADPSAAVPYVRQLLATGRMGEASAIAGRVRAASPGSADAQVLAGDVLMAGGNLAGALDAWRIAGSVRMGSDLLLRSVDAYLKAGHPEDADMLVRAVLTNNPRDRTALRLAAGLAARRGDWSLAGHLLDYLVRTGGGRDARLLADLAFARLQGGDSRGARGPAGAAWRLQRASPQGSEALGLVLARSGKEQALSASLLRKAKAG